MNRNVRQFLLVMILLSGPLLFCLSSSYPFATASHRDINEAAAEGSSLLDPYLKNVLGFSSGLDTEVRNGQGVGKTIREWIRKGGAFEDRLLFDNSFGEVLGGMTRSFRHFHQPLRAWDQAGFKGVWPSSVRWAQTPNQGFGRDASWLDARNSYLNALLAPTQQDRDANFADAFQTVGQVMHLVADSASGPHVRDDAHPFAYNFEKFVAKRFGLITGFISFDSSILQQPTGDSFAVVPIARLWDTNTYDGSNPPGDSDQQVGIAEFTNANFFSEDTIRKIAFSDPELPLPAVDRLVPGMRTIDPRTGEERWYLQKTGDGVPVEHRVVAGVFEGYGPPSPVDYQLDDVVYQDYARHLLPRAIGYAAGIPDYFFRRKIKIEAPDRFVYALAGYEEGNTGSFTKMRFKVSNDTEYPNTSEDTVIQAKLPARIERES